MLQEPGDIDPAGMKPVEQFDLRLRQRSVVEHEVGDHVARQRIAGAQEDVRDVLEVLLGCLREPGHIRFAIGDGVAKDLVHQAPAERRSPAQDAEQLRRAGDRRGVTRLREERDCLVGSISGERLRLNHYGLPLAVLPVEFKAIRYAAARERIGDEMHARDGCLEWLMDCAANKVIAALSIERRCGFECDIDYVGLVPVEIDIMVDGDCSPEHRQRCMNGSKCRSAEIAG